MTDYTPEITALHQAAYLLKLKKVEEATDKIKLALDSVKRKSGERTNNHR